MLEVMMVRPAFSQYESLSQAKVWHAHVPPSPRHSVPPSRFIAKYVPGESIILVWVLRARTMGVEGTGARKAEARPRPPTRMQAVRIF